MDLQSDLFKDTITCPDCNGTGDPYNHEREWIICSRCNGSGEVTIEPNKDSTEEVTFSLLPHSI